MRQDATVTRVQTDGNVTLRTVAGEATIQINPRQIPAFLRPGAVISLQIRAETARAGALQVLLQPRPAGPAQAQAQPPQTQQAQANTATQAPPRSLPPLASGEITRATVLRPTSIASGIGGTPLPAGGGLNPQQAAQAAARYLLTSSPQLRPTGAFQGPLSQSVPQASPAGALPGAAPQPGGFPVTPGSSVSTSAPASPSPAPTGPLSGTPVQGAPAAGQGTSGQNLPGSSPATPPRSTGRPAADHEPRSGTTTLPRHGEAARMQAPSQVSVPGGANAAAAATGVARPTPLPPGTDFPVRVLSVGQTTSNAAPPASGGTVISGMIVATGGSGQAIVNSSLGLLDVAARAVPEQIRSEVRMEMLSRTQADVRGQPGSAPAPFSVLSRDWPSLEESLKALEMAAPQAAAQASATVPRPGPQLTASILFFLTAVRSGSLGSWIGKDGGQALEKANGRLLSGLAGDFQTMSKASDGGPEAGGWRAFFVPLYNNEALEQMRLFVLPAQYNNRGHSGGDENEDEQNADRDGETRFIVDLDLSRLGAFQIDGSVARSALSLTIRTTKALPDGMRADIIEIFEGAAARTGMEGAVHFKVQKEFPPLPIADLVPEGKQTPDMFV